MKSLSAQNAASLVIFMLSGGGSSIAEKPIDDEISLDDLIATYRVLVHSGAPIAEINAIRKHLSAVKGGRLASPRPGRSRFRCWCLTFPTIRRMRWLQARPCPIPPLWRTVTTSPGSTACSNNFPIQCASCFNGTRWMRLPSPMTWPSTARAGGPCCRTRRCWTQREVEAQRHGFTVTIDNSCDDWDYARAADYLLERLRGLRKKSERACLISGGEVTVKVANGGTGGRNQQFALACAAKISGEAITYSAPEPTALTATVPPREQSWTAARSNAPRHAGWIPRLIWRVSTRTRFLSRWAMR